MCSIRDIAKRVLPKHVVRKLRRMRDEARLEEYGEIFNRCQQALASRPVPAEDSGPGFSLLTSVYERTPPAYFLLTAESIRRQTYRKYEWIVLRHGPIPEELAEILDQLSAAGEFRLLNLEENQGAVGGIRYCLQYATNEYTIPMDADDVLVPAALAVAAEHIIHGDYPDFLYSDEDFIENGRLFNPYFRPDWDPVLCFSGSYIYHLEIYKRQAAMELGVYSNDASGLCHDWDTALRFASAGKRFVHIPEVLYHWRRHSNSISNARVKDVHLDSQPAALRGALASRGEAENFSIEEFPLFRGATEYRCRWKHAWPVPVHLVAVNHENWREPEREQIIGFAKSAEIDPDRVRFVSPAADSAIRVRDVTASVRQVPDGEWVCVVDARLRPDAQWFLEEIAGWFTLVDELDFLSGSILTAQDIIVEGGQIFGYGESGLGSPETRRHAMDSGPFSICLRSHCVDAPHSCFFAARGGALKRAIAVAPTGAPFVSLGAWLGAWAARHDRLSAWTPLLHATCRSPFPTSMLGDADAHQSFAAVHGGLLTGSRWYSKWLYKGPGKGWVAPGM